MPKKAAAPKIVDITHPDSVKADPTSVPIIVKHGPMMKDPMMSEAKPEDAVVAKKEEKSPIVTKITLAPVSTDDSKAKDKPEPEADAKKSEEPNEPVKLEAAKEPEPKKDEPEPDPEKPAKKPAEETKPAEPETPAKEEEPAKKPEEETKEPAEKPDEPGEELLPGAEPTDPAAAQAAREAAEKQLALDKLAADGTYFLPINSVEKRKIRNTLLVVLLLLIVLGAVGFLAAMDAGYVHIDGFKAPTDFIKDK